MQKESDMGKYELNVTTGVMMWMMFMVPMLVMMWIMFMVDPMLVMRKVFC